MQLNNLFCRLFIKAFIDIFARLIVMVIIPCVHNDVKAVLLVLIMCEILRILTFVCDLLMSIICLPILSFEIQHLMYLSLSLAIYRDDTFVIFMICIITPFSLNEQNLRRKL